MSQYGIRLKTREFETMGWDEFKALLSGLSADTPLGRIVSIRAEEDKEMLKRFTQYEHSIRNAWRSKHAKQIPRADFDEAMESFKQAFISMARG